jgi:hypothetical protein
MEVSLPVLMEVSLPVILFQSSLSLTWIEGARREDLLLKQNSETKNFMFSVQIALK